MPVKNNLALGSAAALIAPDVYSADNTPVSVDLLGFQAAEILLAIGVGGITFSAIDKIEFKLTHSDDDSIFSDVDAADVVGATVSTGGIIRALTDAKAAADLQRVSYVGGRRYLRLLADFSGTHSSGTAIAAMVNLSQPTRAPVA